jgi:hypothetical protein
MLNVHKPFSLNVLDGMYSERLFCRLNINVYLTNQTATFTESLELVAQRSKLI